MESVTMTRTVMKPEAVCPLARTKEEAECWKIGRMFD